MSDEARDSPASTHSEEKIEDKRVTEQHEQHEQHEQPEDDEDEEYYSGTEGQQEQGQGEQEAESENENQGSDEDEIASDSDESKAVEMPRMDAPSGIGMNDALAKARAIAAKLGTMQKPVAAAAVDEQAARDEQQGYSGRMQQDTRRRSASPDDRENGGRGMRGQKRERSTSRGPQRHDVRRNNRRFEGEPADTEQPVLEFLVPSTLSGLIIGRSGSNLRAIEQRHGVRIQFDGGFDRNAPERGIKIEGPVQSADAARQDILDFVDRHNRQLLARGPQDVAMGSDGFGVAPPADLGAEGMATIMVPSSKVGLVIGRRGESIKSIQMATGARVQVQPDSGRGAPERPIQLIGSPDQIEYARVRIMEIVSAERPPREGPGGYRPDHGPGYPMPVPSRGGPQGPPSQSAYGARGGPGGYGMGQDRFGGPQQPMAADGEEMQIPAEAVGVIIGRGGETIKHLQQASGARIQILQGPEHTGPLRQVTIRGDPSACLRARRMVEEKIEGLQERQGAPAPGGYGGRGGQYGAAAGGHGGYGQQQPMGGGYTGYGYGGEPMDIAGAEPKAQWGQQQQQQPPYYGGAAGGTGYAGYQQPQQQTQQHQQHQQQQQQQPASGEQTMQWTNQQTADYYAQYAATSPEYAQYAEYYRKLAEKDPNGIVPSGN
ncbi:hypothetical protein GGI25_002884 [Coemansia spiralis]|uniref:K Homology domain-containing protein n=1 Tax=Coemansia spiralis TaxID=417178 RepID=A0A9W8G720_9FUNG|nr:hypothetical protein GGI25_002884 [Coemansia spiralis]